jgi:hypothetical protein
VEGLLIKLAKNLKIGIAHRGVLHHSDEESVSLDDWFNEISLSNAFDYVDKTPPKKDFNQYKKLSEKYNLPLLCSGWFYQLGKDENLILENLKMGAELGSKYHNVQIFLHHADGHELTDQEIANVYLKVSDYGEKIGCLPCFEIHINMWSENFLRINSVARIVQEEGGTFRMTLDHSHVVFKMNNEVELGMFGLAEQLENKQIILDPFQEGNISEQWINQGIVSLMHARSVIPNNPKNIKAKHPDGSVGRGVQYPFVKPLEGQFHEEWNEQKLEPWKEVIRKMIKYHYDNDSFLECISTEFIPSTDYGENNTYSLLDNAVGCAKWIRSEIKNYN